MLAIVGLICLLAYIRDVTLAALEGELVTRIFWGTGLAAAACIAAGWGSPSAMRSLTRSAARAS
jgi:hypothetical protein